MVPSIQLAARPGNVGAYFNFIRPMPLTVEEIAFSLAKICRFTGHCNEFYSVAQHSVLVSRLGTTHEERVHGLFHDAVEAVVGDMSSPLKMLIPQYKEIEQKCEEVILEGLGLPRKLCAAVKVNDLRMLAAEKHDLMPDSAMEWAVLKGVKAPTETIVPITNWRHAAMEFLAEARKLGMY